MNKQIFFVVFLAVLASHPAIASVESSLQGLKTTFIGTILPAFAVMGLGLSAFSFFTGNPNAKQHLMYAIVGSAIVFCAQSIVDLIGRVVR